MDLTRDTALAAYLALPGQRTFDLADLALRYLGKELRDDAGDNVQLTLDGSGEEEAALALVLRARATLDLAAALDADLETRGATRLLDEIELPLVGVLAEMERTGIAADTDHFAEMSATLYGEVKAAEQAAYDDRRPRVQPRLAQAAAGGAVHRARAAEDQADQDRLHHRLRGADQPARRHRAPGARAPAAPPRRRQAQVDRGHPDPDGDRRRRPHPHHVQPDDRRDRPAVVDRPEPAEHPDPHRGSAAASARASSSGRLRDAADRGLLADRAAHHGRPVRRRGADGGVRVGPRLPRGDRVPGVRRRPARRRHPSSGPRSRR